MRRTTVLTAVALAMAGPAVPTDAAAPRAAEVAALRTAAVEWRDRVRHLATTLPVDPGLVAAAETRAASPDGDTADLVPAGDLDGDGLADFVDVRRHYTDDEDTGTVTTTTRYEARRGRDGALLWSKPALTGDVPVATTVGRTGAPGLLTVSYRSPEPASVVPSLTLGRAGRTTLAAYDRKGTELWRTAAEGAPDWAAAEPPPAPYYHVVTDIAGLADLVPGGGEDVVLVRSVQSKTAGGGVENDGQVGVVDAATGTYTTLGGTLQAETENIWVTPVGDLNRDGRDDVALAYTTGGRRRLELLSGTGERLLWTSLTIPHTHHWTVTPLPDVTGDGRRDVAVTALYYGSVYGSVDGERAVGEHGEDGWAKTYLLDGRTGRTVWTKLGRAVYAVGDVDGRRGSEVVLGDDAVDRGEPLRAWAYTGSGRLLWSRSLPGRVPGAAAEDSLATWRRAAYDTGTDGAPDIEWSVWDHGGAPSEWSYVSGTVDARNGRVRKDAVGGMTHLAAAVDGAGADGVAVARTEPGDTGGRLTVWRGNRAERLWEVRYDTRDLYVAAHYTSAYRVDRDRCADLVLGASYGDTVLVLSGATGKPIWGLTRTGDGAARSTTRLPRGLRVTTFRRSC